MGILYDPKLSNWTETLTYVATLEALKRTYNPTDRQILRAVEASFDDVVDRQPELREQATKQSTVSSVARAIYGLRDAILLAATEPAGRA